MPHATNHREERHGAPVFPSLLSTSAMVTSFIFSHDAAKVANDSVAQLPHRSSKKQRYLWNAVASSSAPNKKLFGNGGHLAETSPLAKSPTRRPSPPKAAENRTVPLPPTQQARTRPSSSCVHLAVVPELQRWEARYRANSARATRRATQQLSQSNGAADGFLAGSGLCPAAEMKK